MIRFRADAPGNCVGFEQIFAALELDLPDQAALSGAIRPGESGQNRHISGRGLIQLADYAVVVFTRSAGDEGRSKAGLKEFTVLLIVKVSLDE